MSSIGTILRTARNTQGLSLDEIAETTRISKKILHDLEEDSLQNFPESYVRAFIRAYAEALGIDPQTLLRSGKEGSSENNQSVEGYSSERINAAGDSGKAGLSQTATGASPPRQNKQRGVLIFFSIALMAGFAVSLYFIRQSHKQPDVKEVAFPNVVQEWNNKFTQPVQTSESGDTSVNRRDSLTLIGIASDSVWLKLAIDNSVSHNYFLKPQQRIRWMARDSVLLSIGNSGGIVFTLNGIPLGLSGKKGKPVSNLVWNRQTLKKLQQSAVHEKN